MGPSVGQTSINMLKSPRITIGKMVERRISQRPKVIKKCEGVSWNVIQDDN